jgi:hypothetical protein
MEVVGLLDPQAGISLVHSTGVLTSDHTIQVAQIHIRCRRMLLDSLKTTAGSGILSHTHTDIWDPDKHNYQRPRI